jgi:predicted enzyme related to lactoylglutathione lyase
MLKAAVGWRKQVAAAFVAAKGDDGGMAHKVVWFDVPTVDLDRAAAFYSKVLNCDIEVDEFPGGRIAVLPHSGDDVAGCLYQSDVHKPSVDGMLLYFNVNGRLCDAVEAAVAAGGQVLRPKHSLGPHGYRALVLDSEGNRIGLHSQVDS